ncbi:MAG: sigma-E processing peptidase SpoIIGA [Eubacteriales bacterium]|nr:sigma-E processing peptidase SpoIIGA [Eubacteriales bacterium]
MRITFYWDVLFLVNFLSGIVVFIITSYFCSIKANVLRICLAAMLESILFLFLLGSPSVLTGLSGVLCLLGTTFGVTIIAYGVEKCVYCWFCSTTIMFLIGSIMNYAKMITNQTVLSICGWLVLFIGSTVSCLFLLLYIKKSKCNRKHMVSCIVENNGKIEKTVAYVDTGNLLKDPLTGRFVVIISKEIIAKCLEEAALKIVDAYEKNGYLNYESTLFYDLQKKYGFHEITYQSVGNFSGKLLCIYIEKIEVMEEQSVFERQPVAVVDPKLFENKAYQALLFDFEA